MTTTALRLAYDYSMEQRLYGQAIFLAERMLDGEKGGRKGDTPNATLNTQYLLALALYHDHQIARAYYILQSSLSSTAAPWTYPARHLLAQCCELLSRFEEGIRALIIAYDEEERLPTVIANGAAGAFLLGQLYEKNLQCHLALPAYEKSLEAGPFMFAAYERIVALRRRGLGDDSEGAAEGSIADPEVCFAVERLNDWYASSETKRASTLTSSADIKSGLLKDQRAPRRPPAEPTVSCNSSMSSSTSMRSLQQTRKGKEHTPETSGRGHQQHSPVDTTAAPLAEVLQHFGELHKASTHLDLPTARSVANDRMTPAQRESRYTVLKLAEAAFDRGEYDEAEGQFATLLTAYPFITEGVGKYSTLLWHQKKRKSLIDLSRRVLTYGRLRSESWICAANLDSMNLDHKEARQKLEKAKLLDHCDATICCLIGHELSSMEQFEQAAFAYSLALKRDPAAYAAWFGISQLCRRQDRLDEAESYLRRAIEVNPYHPVLKVALASLLSYRSRTDEALTVLDAVCVAAGSGSTKNGAYLNAFYERSRLLANQGRIEEAVIDARRVVEALPNEASGHALLGQLLARSGSTDAEALEHLNLALEPTGYGLQGSTGVRGPVDEGVKTIVDLINNLSSGGGRKSLAEATILQENRHPLPIHQRLRFNSFSSAAASELPNGSLNRPNRRSEGSNGDQPQRMSISSSMLDSVLEEGSDDSPTPSGHHHSPSRAVRQMSWTREDPLAPFFFPLPASLGRSQLIQRQQNRGGQAMSVPERAVGRSGPGASEAMDAQQQGSVVDIQRPSRPPPPSPVSVALHASDSIPQPLDEGAPLDRHA
ncbi:anaphase-promoting complex subunit cdc27 [Perkinsus olseni]|uniref:Anaphase-promoting complex subunit cdc27 n=1 Tax=Perkinsus olseni TaxID=32597 RepID=A0A7J6MAW5_PEROL|nr:anaphase-promoting complex subunit cdc27 [Perkinsus olseni]